MGINLKKKRLEMLIGIKFMRCDFIYMDYSLWVWIFKIPFGFAFLHILNPLPQKLLSFSKNKTGMLHWPKWMMGRTGGKQHSAEVGTHAEQGVTRRETSWFERILSAEVWFCFFLFFSKIQKWHFKKEKEKNELRRKKTKRNPEEMD